MDTLQVVSAHTMLKLRTAATGDATLGEQVQPYIERSPHLILDVEGILFSSMLIGELLNVHKRFHEHWKGEAPPIALVNLTATSRDVFERTRLSEYFAIHLTLADAMQAGTLQDSVLPAAAS